MGEFAMKNIWYFQLHTQPAIIFLVGMSVASVGFQPEQDNF